ncbi:MAG: hypothetical protein A2X86_15260 [Bdellovibrionales bacterium GWA2_49_15]|nr:MAG: hypothetical protein A2X86_15260 [Bdellovibrionales bacterium GWA2_49_15]HAZ13296.1 hypothetical protein [Bdellovibrionales bacterium]
MGKILRPFYPESNDTISVSGIVTKQELCLHALYLITGELKNVLIREKPDRPPARQNGLWESTCFELFLKHPRTPEYVEFNFAPNGDWNAYHFNDYRKDMQEFQGLENLEITFSQTKDAYQLKASIILKEKSSFLTDNAEGRHVYAGLTAVLEKTSGQKNYWALQHSGPKPDFHLAPSFTLLL